MPTHRVSLTDDQDRFIGDAVKAGRYSSANDALREGLRLLERRDADDVAKLARFEMLVAEGQAAYERGEYEEVARENLAGWLASLGRTGRSAIAE